MTENTENIPAVPKAQRPAEPVLIASGGDKDVVYLSHAVYKNDFRRKSLTVHHVQRRLTTLGFTDADSDLDGYYGDLTKYSVEQFQESKNYDVTGLMDRKTFSALFRNDNHVLVSFD